VTSPNQKTNAHHKLTTQFPTKINKLPNFSQQNQKRVIKVLDFMPPTMQYQSIAPQLEGVEDATKSLF
jgi:hypothetical protein